MPNFDFPIVDKERTWKILDAMAPIAKAHELQSGTRLPCMAAGEACGDLGHHWCEKPYEQLKDNLAAVDLTLTQEELGRLDEVSALPPEYPGWMLQFQGADRLEAVDRLKSFREASN